MERGSLVLNGLMEGLYILYLSTCRSRPIIGQLRTTRIMKMMQTVLVTKCDTIRPHFFFLYLKDFPYKKIKWLFQPLFYFYRSPKSFFKNFFSRRAILYVKSCLQWLLIVILPTLGKLAILFLFCPTLTRPLRKNPSNREK